MKIILLAPLPPPAGGIATWAVKMMNTTLKNGWEVVVVNERLIGSRETWGNSRKNLLVEIKRCFIIWKWLWRTLEDDAVKIVQACIPASTTGMLREYICALLTIIRGRRFIVHYHCTVPNMVTTKTGRLVFRLLTNNSDSVIVLNRSSEEFAKRYTKTPIFIIPNFIERKAVKADNARVISSRIGRVLYVGGVVESKGCYEIIEVAKEYPEIEFRLVGNPEKRILEIDKPPNVILCGELSRGEVEQELDEADVFMFVSHGEGFSIALLEAMAQGLPCIVSDCGSNSEMIEENGGFVVPVKDITAMIEAIKELVADSDRRHAQSEWNIKKVKKCYVEHIVTDMYVDVYENLLN